MLNKDYILKMINEIPAIPSVLKACEQAVEESDIENAAILASSDRALINYMRNIVNKPIFGFREEIKSPKQLFSVLGRQKLIRILHTYYIHIITPKIWEVFNMNTNKFLSLQMNFLDNWDKILKQANIQDEEIRDCISLIPAGIILCEKIFENNLRFSSIIMQVRNTSYNDILKQICGIDIFGLLSIVAKKWDFSDKVIEMLKNLDKQTDNRSILLMKLLIAYEFSRPDFKDSGLGNFFDFDVQADDETMEIFMRVLDNETDF